MTNRCRKAWLFGSAWPSVLLGASLMGASGELAALPLVKPVLSTLPRLLIEDVPTAGPVVQDNRSSAVDHTPLAELNRALAAARAKLQRLNQAAEALAGVAALREELTTLEAENRRLSTELQTMRARNDDLQRADDVAQVRAAELEQALSESAAEAKGLNGKLAALRWQNAELANNLSQTQQAQEQAEADTGFVRAELTARIAELEQAVEKATEERSRLRERLAATTERLNEANRALAGAEQERDLALGQLDERDVEAERLRGELEVTRTELEQVNAARQDLETRLTGMESAASAATDEARQNLLAVETQIAALSSTLATVELSPTTAKNLEQEASSADTVDIDNADESEANVRPGQDATRSYTDQSQATPSAGPSRPSDSELTLVKLSERTGEGSKTFVELTADLPIESRIQAQSLLADLQAQPDPEGLKMIVPGAELFAVNSEQVRDAAHESLAKVAELINLYKSQPVLIIGHTDVMGESGYNKTLSERRANLVRQFFIDHFEVDATRLSTQGMGEQRPIATNATADGRRANRRVEVVILN